MARTVSDVMTANPETIEVTEPVAEAARKMRSSDAGAIVVLDHGQVAGIVTDRDITLRVVAEDRGGDTPVREACSSTELTTVRPDTDLDEAVRLMRGKAVRRLPVVQNNQPVGIVSLGDLAIERDPDSALGDISAAKGNE
ncbi:CBS domain-containing protein [Allostreptomyces psammosilenae]|uniref:CBS domain-containing protein n=1 Tax=Allostreptomyces psammosilenae TaxID=1892865 RepID=A0A852ZQV8_9ACTN|nr:CBS domain-containing protein [Allostreptomyces psammosilenae]NYI04135.1 CBS domain-containing protein [Allostreptomyces psammosilenae]